jgi:hypothetical protein
MPTYKYSPVQDSEVGSSGAAERALGAKSFNGDPFSKKRDMCVAL